MLEQLEKANNEIANLLIGNTAVRCAIQQSHTQVELEPDYGLAASECQKVFEAAIKYLQTAKVETPMSVDSAKLSRLDGGLYQSWVWTEDYPDNIFGRSFRFMVKENYTDPLCNPSEQEIAMLDKGAQLLHDLLPMLTESALCHTHLIGCFSDNGFWKKTASSSQFRVGGTIFLNRYLLRNPWWVAEHMLHESLHQKLYDIERGHSVLEVKSNPKVCSLWNAAKMGNANQWETHRVFAAFHVYVHLALLAQVAEKRAIELEKIYGPKEGMVESSKAFERAYYLGEKLKETCWDELGLAL